MRLKIAIIGTRGIPNQYGGFEQLAEHLSVGLVKMGHEISVYSSHTHPYQKKEWNAVEIIHCKDPEPTLGSAGQFLYDLNCVRDARKRNFDVLLFLGYSSSSVWGRWYPRQSVIISNMDGLEWKRLKYSRPVRIFLKWAEKWAVKHSDFFIADSLAIQSYLSEQYDIRSAYIAYGATIFNKERAGLLERHGLQKQRYFMLMARMERENNIEAILTGFHQTSSSCLFVVLGNTNNRYGRNIVKKFCDDRRILFLGPMYDAGDTHTFKTNCLIYFHGHSVGGTNPSLLEAMASKALIAAHDNQFNRAILEEDGYFFKAGQDVKKIVESVNLGEKEEKMISNNFLKIKQHFNWSMIVKKYGDFIENCYQLSRY